MDSPIRRWSIGGIRGPGGGRVRPGIDRRGPDGRPASGGRAARYPASDSSLLALIGPEGGWTDDEIARLTEAGAVPVSLGPRVLRVETACIAVAAAVALHVASARDRGHRS
ncbi:MAG: RNA methyltransferase [Planctomycetes bacterium]|nr:RNA methyltransferase [Planctomycetota bacterium]